MIPDFGADLAKPSETASASAPYRELIELGLNKGRNAKAIWQDLVDDHGFIGGYQSVKRFINKLRGPASPPQPCAVIVTGPGEDYVEFRIMVSQGLRGAAEDALTLFGG